MKKVFLSLAIFLSASLTVFAGQQKGKAGNRGKTVLPKELSLSDEQQKKVESLDADFKTQFEALRADTSITKENKRAKRQELSKQHKVQVQNVLTTEQRSRLSDLNKQTDKRENRKSRRNKDLAQQSDNRSDGRKRSGERFSKEMNLTAAQEVQIRALNEEFRSKSKESREQHRAAVNAILTPEQQAKMKEQGKPSREFRKHGGKRSGGRRNLDAQTVAKLDSLKSNFKKEKQAIEMSRIAPEEQARRIEELRTKYREEKREITMNAKNTNTTKTERRRV
ncbi:hypothetical protein [Dysgonomonas sp. ZJ279]|uniref:hypothetical protein n=1 Tax=Dysgonomonas sp. ZJ279 TaxID=2709796 RepID=UPI0013EC12C8|nr:hypothetical protein [Dysgonomonas sp. ZJ279]